MGDYPVSSNAEGPDESSQTAFSRGKITLYTKKPIGGMIIKPHYQTQSNNTTSQEDFVGGNAEAEGKRIVLQLQRKIHARPSIQPAVEQTEEEASDVDPQISLHALTGHTGPQTMRVAGRIGSQRVLVLIDSGSMHNFIDQRLARHLGLLVTPIDKFWVTVANGEKLSCREKHEEVKLVIQGLDMAVTFFSVPLNGLDSVLGIQWLEKLGPVTCDLGKLSMTLTHRDKVYEIVAQCKLRGQAISNTMLGRQVSSGGEVFAIAVRQAKTESHSL
ncbi:hypothetical protein Pint_33768 [Pistacia integerrima]|uniref:Uncharacterized protein n=1 Tax=Pistacia integerrima TaxID=434235 RepID=A0ACC0X5S0_9ROSI|nr:hypothetical protein Pint_33768 [Pistacia integerrima]